MMLYALSCMVSDIRHRSISPVQCLAAGIIGAILFAMSFINSSTDISEHICFQLSAFIPGIFVIILSALTKGAVGIGDGIFVLVCGWYMGLGEVAVMLITAWLLCAAASLFLIVKKGLRHTKTNMTLPFLAFAVPVLMVMKISALLLQ